MLLPSQLLDGLDGAHWCHALAASPLVALAVDGSAAAQSRPLVLSGKRLYLRRYWTYERRIDSALRQRLAVQETVSADLPQRLNGLFDQPPPNGVVDWQKLACALATRGRSASSPAAPAPARPPPWCACWHCCKRQRWSRARPCASVWRRPPARRRRG